MKITKRQDGRYCANVKVSNGKYKMVYGKTKREVTEKVNQLKEAVIKDEYVEHDLVTVSDWFDYYLENCTSNLKETTFRRYKGDINNHIKPYFKDLKLQKLTPIEIQAFINDLTKKVSPKSVSNCYGVLSKGCNMAMTFNKIPKNPCKNIVLPKKEQKEMVILTEEEIPLFLEKAYELTDVGDFFEFILLTGMRISEVFGLTEDRYNREESSILIDRQQTRKGIPDFTTPKHDVIRKIYLGKRGREIIENRIKQNDGKKPFNVPYIFVSRTGKFFNRSYVHRRFCLVKKAIGKENIRMHDLRHTYAVMALKSGMDIKTLQTNLGHASPSFTLKVYAHTTNKMKQESINNLENMISNLS